MTPPRPPVPCTLFDPVTRRHLDALGVGAGWRCWEVGGGGPSTPAWLAERVGADGWVAGDGRDVAWATGAEPFEVRRHDVVRRRAAGETFDLVHARLVLARVADRHAALRHMVRTLRPGGWLVIEEIDVDFQPCATPDASNPQQYLSNRIRAGLLAVLGQHGVDLELGRKVPRLLREAGLVDVAADGYFPLASPAAAALEAAAIEHARHALVALRAASDEELDTHLGAARAGSVDVATPPAHLGLGPPPVRSSLESGDVRIWAGIVSETATDPARRRIRPVRVLSGPRAEPRRERIPPSRQSLNRARALSPMNLRRSASGNAATSSLRSWMYSGVWSAWGKSDAHRNRSTP